MHFIEPHDQELIGGDAGLTSQEIANSLGASLSHVNEKISRPAFKKLCETNRYEITAVAIKSGKRGRPGLNYVLSKRAAKSLVATFESEIGYRYLDFLFDCEEAAEKARDLMPELLEALRQVAEQQKEIEKLKLRGEPGPRSNMIPVPVYETDLLGENIVVRYEQRKMDELSDLLRLKGQIRRMHKIQKGLAAKVDKLSESLDVEEAKKQKQILSIVKD